MKTQEATLARLMGMAQRGDREAYRVLLGECRTWLMGYFRGRIAPRHLEDLVQDTLVSLHRKRASYDPARPFLPWLAAIARYRWVDHMRRLYRNEEDAIGADIAAEPEEPAIAARLSLDRLFSYLPQAQATAIELVKVEGLSIREASRASGQSESLVKVNIHRGLRKLAAMIEKE